MTSIFRKLNQKRHWDGVQWLSAGDVQSEAIKCLRTLENELSVYVLEKPEVQMDRVVAALALTRDSVAHLDLAIVPEALLDTCEIERVRTKANTPDSLVNEWHLDLVELTVCKIAIFASSIKNKGKIQRYCESRVEMAIQQSLATDFIAVEKINEKMIQSLERHGISIPASHHSSN